MKKTLLAFLLCLIAAPSFALDCAQFNLVGRFKVSHQTQSCKATVVDTGRSTENLRLYKVAEACSKWKWKGQIIGLFQDPRIAECALMVGDFDIYPMTEDSTLDHMIFEDFQGNKFLQFDRI